MFLRSVAVSVLAAGLSTSAISKTEYAMDFRIAPDVRHVIETSSAIDKKRANSAIGIGNRFVTARYSIADYPDHPDSWDEWERDIGPLMAINVTQWADVWEKEGWILEAPMSGAPGVGMLLSCPSVELIRIELRPERTSLHYKSVLLGVATTGGKPRVLETEKSGKPYLLEIVLNRSSQIVKVHTSEKTIAVNFQLLINYEQKEIKRWDGKAANRLPDKKREELESAKRLLLRIEESARSCAQVGIGQKGPGSDF